MFGWLRTVAERAVDVVIVGGGPAGLQAALVLGRARRTVVVGASIGIDPSGRTAVPGVWAVGSATDPTLTIARSLGHATGVAIAINESWVDEDVTVSSAPATG